jgi:predicted AlkP superfamily phosphohydrolase/phosphomutase
MKHPVIAIGLDAADPELLEKWISEGHLPNLARLRQKGGYARLNNFDYYRAETPWTTFLTGCSPEKTGYWSPVKFYEGTYEVEEVEAYDFLEYQPFYALGKDYQVAIVDVPQTTLTERAEGVQVLAWGAHSPMTPSHSQPPSLFQELIEKHGEHPRLRNDHASCMNIKALNKLKEDLKVGISRRSAICQDLLERQPWDLLLTIFGETHSAGHYFWHLSQPTHPLYSVFKTKMVDDPLLETFIAVDQEIGAITAKAPENAHILVFAAHGMGDNVMDLPSMLFLPELLYRWNFPHRKGIAPGKIGEPVGDLITKGKIERGWVGAVWGQKHDSNPLRGWLRLKLPNKVFKFIETLFGKSQSNDLTSPFRLIEEANPMHFFQSALWYQSFWKEMKAFALPSYSEGYIRINLKGREPSGVVAPEDYETVCEEICKFLSTVKDARTGHPMVAKTVRTRKNPCDDNAKLPDADIVVIWQEENATDTVDSPVVGRIGPVPYNRTGSHRCHGFLLANGPNVEPCSDLPVGHALDLAPTILNLMGASQPSHMEGQPLIKPLSFV